MILNWGALLAKMASKFKPRTSFSNVCGKFVRSAKESNPTRVNYELYHLTFLLNTEFSKTKEKRILGCWKGES